MSDRFRADCEELIELSNKQIPRLASDVQMSASMISDLSTARTTWGTGPFTSWWIDETYEDLRQLFEKTQKDMVKTLEEVASALNAVAENYLRVDEEIS